MRLTSFLLFLSSSHDKRTPLHRLAISSSSEPNPNPWKSKSAASLPSDDDETDVIFSTEYENLSSSTKQRLRGSELASSQPDLFYLHLAYDHLATCSLKAVEALPSIKFSKGDDYISRWWSAAKKWNLLGQEMLALEEGEGNVTHTRVTETDVHLKSSVNDQRNDSAGAQAWSRRQGRAPLKALYTMSMVSRARVLCIGDVHGCIDELCDLLRQVNYKPWDTVLFLGDLVAKGPSSIDVIRLAMDIGALAVRGNHDHEVIKQCMLIITCKHHFALILQTSCTASKSEGTRPSRDGRPVYAAASICKLR